MTLTIKRSFPAVVGPNTRLLILGSLPGERSLQQQQYYAHPRNQFWTLMGEVIGRDLIRLPYPERLATLRAVQIGLWDVVQSAARSGSLDANIRGHIPNALAELVARLPSLAAVAFNGRTSAALGFRHFRHMDHLALIELPSSSPAFTLPIAAKRDAWLQLRAWI